MCYKKKRKTFAARSNEASKGSDCSYTLPAHYEIFLAELEEACRQGDSHLKEAIERLVPQMATTRREGRQTLGNPDVPLEDVPPEMKCTTSLSQVKPPLSGCIAAIITRELGPVPSSIEEATVRNPLQEDNSNQAPANFLVDVAVVATTESSNIATAHSAPKGKVANSQGETVRVATLLKGLQPQREVSSKDSGK